jgi:hypothetical protein
MIIVVKAQPRLVDGNTKFHRLYVEGPERCCGDDISELKGDLESPGNQQAGSTSQPPLNEPTKQQLQDALNQLKNTTQPGEEVTIYICAHGNGGKPRKAGDGGISDGDEPYDEWVWLNDKKVADKKANSPDEVLTDDELADMLEGFKECVTIVVIVDSCYGGGFTGGTDDIPEDDHHAVIGTTGTCPIDPPGLLGGLISTLGEDVADGAGEKEADTNGDGKVTAEELKDWLKKRGWKLGPPDDQNPGKIKNGKSKIRGLEGVQPAIPTTTPDTFTPSPGSWITISGSDFANSSFVNFYLVKPDLTQLYLDHTQTDQNGYFTKTVMIPSDLCGEHLLLAEDSEDNIDWSILNIDGDAVGGIVVPVDKLTLLAPYIGFASFSAVATVVTAVYVKRVKHRKEKQ